MSFLRRPLQAQPLPQAAAVLVVLAFALRSLIPAGYMPDMHPRQTAQAGFVSLVICTGMGVGTVYLPEGQAPDASNHPAAPVLPNHIPCPFAAAFSHGVLTASPMPTPLFQAKPASEIFIPAASIVTRFTLYQAQAPPAFS